MRGHTFRDSHFMKAASRLAQKIVFGTFLSDMRYYDIIDCLGDDALAYKVLAAREAEAARARFSSLM